MIITLGIKIIISLFLVALFYWHIKSYAYRYAGRIADYLKLTILYPFEVAKGMIELILIVLFHFIFCYLLLKLSGLNITKIGLFSCPHPFLLVEGMLLGLGIMGTASLLGRFYIEIMRYFMSRAYPKDLKNWLAMARSGWIRHHFHTLQILPIPIALLVTLGQVCAEEIVFRGICIHYFLTYGKLAALIISTSLFMYMQMFHMPNKVSGIFPVIGALVMGLVAGFLYLQTNILLPLIIAHITFFSAAVL